MGNLVYGIDELKKHSLKSNMMHIFEEDPAAVESISEVFSEGIFYGRIRFNSFDLGWKDEMLDSTIVSRENSTIAAIGGSFIYRSAYLHGFGIGLGLYTSQAQGTLDDDEAYLYRAGHDLLNRHDVLSKGKGGISTFAQAYLEYKSSDISMKIGRQIYESFLTKSNDTKMIPNTFEGISGNIVLRPKTQLSMAYLTKQKLRGRSSFHHIFAVGDDPSDPYAIFTQNDDTGMHFGLTLSALEDRGIDDRLIVVEAKDTSIEYLTLNMNYTAVPQLLSSLMIQADYRLYLGGWSIIPGIRYMQQFDNGAGAIGGANIRGITKGYTNEDSLDTALYAARIDIVEDGFKVRFGASKVTDAGDIVAPWRGFPTGGFTRAMAQHNWFANTFSYMMQVDYEFTDISDFMLMSRIALQDFDDSKLGVQADSKIFTLDLLKGLGESSYYLKTRFAHVSGDDDTVLSNGFRKLNPSYKEIRIEINYLF